MKTIMVSLLAVFPMLLFGEIISIPGQMEAIQETSVWKFNYNANRGRLPNSIQWESSYPSSAVTIGSGPLLQCLNDYSSNDLYSVFYLKNTSLLNSMKKYIMIDFKIKAINFGSNDYFFMLIMRVPNGDNVPVQVVVKLANSKIQTSSITTTLSTNFGTNLRRVSVFVNLESQKMYVYLNSYIIIIDQIPTQPGSDLKLAWGDGSNSVGGSFQLEYMKVTNSQTYNPLLYPIY